MKRSYTPRAEGIARGLTNVGRPLWSWEILAACRADDPTLTEACLSHTLARMVKSGTAVKVRRGLYAAPGVAIPADAPRAIYRTHRMARRELRLSSVVSMTRWEIVSVLVDGWDVDAEASHTDQQCRRLSQIAKLPEVPAARTAAQSRLFDFWRKNLALISGAQREVRVLRHPMVTGSPALRRDLLFWFIVSKIGLAEEMIQFILSTAKSGPAEIAVLMDQQKALCAVRGWRYSDSAHRSIVSSLIGLLRRAGVRFLPRPCKGMVQIAPDCTGLGIKTSAEYRETVERLWVELVG